MKLTLTSFAFAGLAAAAARDGIYLNPRWYPGWNSTTYACALHVLARHC